MDGVRKGKGKVKDTKR